MTTLAAAGTPWRSPSTVHLIGQAHIDPVWLWDVDEGRAEVRATIRSALDRLEEYPGFIFTMNQVVFCAWVERADPALFARLRAAVRAGRVQLDGGWWVEPDVNAPSAESLVRQALLGQRWLAARFGFVTEVGLAQDAFGHPASLPQLLRGAGLTSWVFLRPGPHEAALPWAFRWTSADGASVVAYRIPDEYNSGPAALGAHLDRARQVVPRDVDLALFYGVGNHGGGPTRANLDDVARVSAIDDRIRLRCSSLGEFLPRLAAYDLPEVRGDLHHHAPGCYSAWGRLKRTHRTAEYRLLAAERLATAATALRGGPFPRGRLQHAWKTLLFHEFHDILAGTAEPEAGAAAVEHLAGVAAEAADVAGDAVQAIATRVAVPYVDGTRPVLLVNPDAVPRHQVVELPVWGMVSGPLRVLDDRSGRALPSQEVRPAVTVTGGVRRLAAQVRLPALGWRLLRVAPGTAPAPSSPVTGTPPAAAPPELAAACLWACRDGLAVGVDRADGALRWLSGADGANTVAGSALVAVPDPSDTWGHGIRAFRGAGAPFTPAGPARVVEDGPVRRCLRAALRLAGSDATVSYTVDAAAPGVRVDVRLGWRHRHAVAKWRLATTLVAPTVTWSVAYGAVTRPADGSECPLGQWLRLAAGTGALGLASASVHAADVDDAVVGLTLARSPLAAHHAPAPADPATATPPGWTSATTTCRSSSCPAPAPLPSSATWRRSSPSRPARSPRARTRAPSRRWAASSASAPPTPATGSGSRS